MFHTPGTAAGPSKLLILLTQQLLHDALLSPTALIDYVWDTHGTVDALHVASVHPVINPKTDQSVVAIGSKLLEERSRSSTFLLSHLAKQKNFRRALC